MDCALNICVDSKMAHNNPLVITQQEEQGGGITVTDHENTPLLISSDKEAKIKQSMLSRLKDRVFVKSKAANMIILWNLLVSFLYGIMLNPGVSIVGINTNADDPYIILLNLSMTVGPSVYGYVAICLLFYPLAGYLGDVCFGRYKTVRCSLWTIWITLLTAGVVASGGFIYFLVTSSLFVYYNDPTAFPIAFFSVTIVCAVVTFIGISVGFAGFRANVIQFGMDQLQDSPARDSSLFILWFLATLYTGIGLGKISWSLMFSCYPFLIAMICANVWMFVLVMPISLCVGHCKRRWFILNPGMGNPCKLVRKVTSFVRKHKIPVQRSAFTYWEDDIPSGLDLGKNKYGGPFTTEQVEDVKAFFGILKVLLSLGPFFTVDFAATGSLLMLGNHMSLARGTRDYICKDFGNFLTNGGTLYPLLIVLIIILYVLIPQRFVQKYTPGMLKRIGIGLCLTTVSLICSLSMDTAGHFIGNLNAPCLFVSLLNNSLIPTPEEIQTLDISRYFLLIQNILTAVAYILIYGGTFEFICAQSPHSVKGFLIGVFFAINGLFQLLGVCGHRILLPFNFWSDYFPSCGFGYYLVNIVISIIGVIAFTYTAKNYKYRQRDEFCDERRYIEEYYENAVSHNPPPNPGDTENLRNYLQNV